MKKEIEDIDKELKKNKANDELTHKLNSKRENYKKWVLIISQTQPKLEDAYKLLIKTIKCYMKCLSYSSKYDTTVTYRIIGLWFGNQQMYIYHLFIYCK